MDDRRTHFLTLTGDACAAAGLASIEVEFTLADGTTARGVPSPLQREEPAALGQTGYANELLVNGGSIRLDTVVGFSVRTP